MTDSKYVRDGIVYMLTVNSANRPLGIGAWHCSSCDVGGSGTVQEEPVSAIASARALADRHHDEKHRRSSRSASRGLA